MKWSEYAASDAGRLEYEIQENAQLRAELRAAVAALRQVQWGNTVIGDWNLPRYLCPLCDQVERRGHSPDCHVGAVIENYDAKHPEGR